MKRTRTRTMLTAPRRKAIYGIVAVLVFAGVAFGLVSEEQVLSTFAVVTAALAGVANIMAFFNTSFEE